MTGFAEWAPNPHALIVHLPIGLLVTGVVADLIALWRRDPAPVITISTGLYLAGTAALAAAYITGRGAAPVVHATGLAQALIPRHWDWAFWCVWFFGLVTAGRVVLLLRTRRPRRVIATGLAAAGLVGLVLLTITAELGARLVYQHGVGVAAPEAVGGRESGPPAEMPD